MNIDKHTLLTIAAESPAMREFLVNSYLENTKADLGYFIESIKDVTVKAYGFNNLIAAIKAVREESVKKETRNLWAAAFPDIEIQFDDSRGYLMLGSAKRVTDKLLDR